MGTTYYMGTAGVDTNDGLTSATAFLSFTKGCQTVVAGDTLVVLSGNYQGSVYINSGFAVNGNATSAITIQSEYRGAAKIKALAAPAAGSGNNACFEIRRDYWVIDGFELSGLDGYTGDTWTIGGTEWYNGIYLTGDNCTAKNCIVHDMAKSTNAAAQGGGGVLTEYFYGGSSQSVVNCEIYKIGSSSIQGSSVHGIYIASERGQAIGNLIYNCNSVGIQAWHAAIQNYYVNNTVFNCNFGLLIGSGDAGAIPGGNINSRVFNNIAFDNRNSGIVEQGTIGTGNLYSNNQSFGNPTNWSLNANSTHTSDVASSPTFVNYIAAGGGDYHLLTASPCVNSGLISLGTVDAPTTDLSGVSRPVGNFWDLGAFEFVAGSPPDNTNAFSGSLRRRFRY